MPRSFLLFSSKYVKCVSPIQQHSASHCVQITVLSLLSAVRGGGKQQMTHWCEMITQLLCDFLLLLTKCVTSDGWIRAHGNQFALHIAPASLNKRAEGGVNEVCLQRAHSLKLPVILFSLSHRNWVSVADLFHRFGFINEKKKTSCCPILRDKANWDFPLTESCKNITRPHKLIWWHWF